MILSNDNTYHSDSTRREELKIDERNIVELPFMEQLRLLGWNDGKCQVIELPMQQSSQDSFRKSFSEVVLEPKLRDALKAINPFLTEGQTEEVINRITISQGCDLLENNERIYHLMVDGTTVAINEQTGEHSPHVSYIDYEHPERNIFTAISQFKVAIPGTDHHIIPDIVLFINGLPVVVIEAKSPKIENALPEAIDQLLRYSEQRGDTGEGNPALFFYNQILIVTNRNQAKAGTITTHREKHFYRWADPYPMTLNDLKHGVSTPNDQQRLVAGMLVKQNLLDLIRVFTLYSINDSGKKIKIVCRYQQFRAVKKMTKRLIEGENPIERGGILWHTQGSGKSLTMMFLVRQMHLIPELMSWKVVFVTDRTQLEEQLGETGGGIGFNLKKAEFINPKNPPIIRKGQQLYSLKELLSTNTSDLVMAMIHKFQESGELSDLQVFPILNESSKILILTDEAHRSQYSLLGANLERALPNATRIGFTGTPTSKTERLYRDYIDSYTMRQSVDDGVTLEIIYQGFTHNAEVGNKEDMDKQFADIFSDYNIEERLQILGFGSRDAYLDSEVTIREKAKNMLNHYVEQIFSGGFKAQIIANSRIAATIYKRMIEEALVSKVEELKQSNPMNLDLVRLSRLRCAVVISGDRNDEAAIKQYSDSTYHQRSIKAFKLPFDGEDEDDKTIKGDVGIIIVNNMLTTGFDAPIEQVLYLDRVLVAHNLLQAITRTNRIGDEGKDYGFVIDYVGIGHNLKKAIDYYDVKQGQVDFDETDSTLTTMVDEDVLLRALKVAHKNIWDFIKSKGLADLSDQDAFYDLFYDEDVRAEWLTLYGEFTKTFNAVMPCKEALDYFTDWKRMTEINALAHKYLRDGRFSMKGIPSKLRAIADVYLQSKGIDERVAPISIMSEKFSENVKEHATDKTKAAETEHAIRNYINVNIDEDPELFASFSKALEDILKNFMGNWKKIFEELEKLREQIRNREQENTFGLNRKKQMPFFRIFKTELYNNSELTEDQVGTNVALTINVVDKLQTELSLLGFWNNVPAQNRLKADLQKILLSQDFYRLPGMVAKYKQIISRIMEVAKANHSKIVSDR